ncbi:MAG: 30S ribosome-binding factor RbfA [Pseudomonadota bacterium]
MKRTTKQSRGPSQRQLRVGELIRQVLSETLLRGDLQDPDLDGVSVTVSEVRPSPDLRTATVFCAPLGQANADRVVAALNRRRAPLQHAIGREASLKFTPRLTFKRDTSFDEGEKITHLLRSSTVSRDLDTEEVDISGPTPAQAPEDGR